MIKVSNLTKTFETKEGKVEALRNVSFCVEDGEIYGIIGMSGAGKSTLVRCINMLEKPDEGSIVIDGVDVTELNEKQLRQERKKISMIFQSFNLLMQRNCLKNVCFPLELAGCSAKDAKQKALRLLDIVGLSDKAKAYPAQLSGGQQQRVAIARALASNPNVLLCDEATSALDPSTTKSVLALIKEINKNLGITVIINTHQMSVVEEICDKVTILENGAVAESGRVEEIFAAPSSEAGKKLVFPEGFSDANINVGSDEVVLRVVFNGALAAGEPLITRMAIKEGIEANILFASTKCLGDKVYGTMLLGVPADEQTKNRAKAFLTAKNGVLCEKVQNDVACRNI